MYSTIQEAWNNDHMELYANHFKQAKFNTVSEKFTSNNNNYFNIHENYGSSQPSKKIVKKKKKKQKKKKKKKKISPKTTVSSSTTVNPIIRSIKSKIKCKDVIKHVKKCRKCRKKLEKYINKNKIVIDMNPIEIRKMLLCLILIGMFIMLFNMITEMRYKRN